MFKKIVSFIKYHNAVSIGISLVLVLSFSAMASNEGIKNKIIGEEIVTEQGVDNSAFLAADLENFDLAMEITNVMEDPELLESSEPSEDSKSGKAGNYYIDYQYKTLGIQDDVWRKILRQKQMVISKAALAGRDLGLYVSEELGEIIDNEIAYLKEVQKNEEEKGQTFVQETTKYTGLIGLVLDTKTKELPGYEPVVKPPEIVVQPETAPIIQPEPINPTIPTDAGTLTKVRKTTMALLARRKIAVLPPAALIIYGW